MPTLNKTSTEQQQEAEEVKDAHPRKGADLLLSLSAPPKAAVDAGTKPVITPQDAVVRGAGGSEQHSFSMPSGFPVGVATSGTSNHRLYHSPIKLNAAAPLAAAAAAAARETNPVSFPSWSPTYNNGKVPVYQASFGPSPPTNAFVQEAVAGAKRQVSHDSESTGEVKRPKAAAAKAVPQQDSTGKNRIISPSSSNERSEDDGETIATTDPQSNAPPSARFGAGAATATVPPPGYWQQAPYYPPASFAAGYAASTFPHWGLYGAPPAAMYPPFMAAKQPSLQASQEASDDFVASNGFNRCIPLKHPLPNRFWGNAEVMNERKLPDFSRLVNFPDYLARGRKGETQAVDGKKHCVMCGKLRICSASSLSRSNKKDEQQESMHIIPKQNKGVCTACDVAVWHVTDQNYEIKWCKGCKNFRPWAAFGEKGLATKCARCRQRQKEKYASQKHENCLSEEKKEDDTLAARGDRKAGGST